MHAGSHYTIREILAWTRREAVVFLCLGAAPLALQWVGVKMPPLPWQPVALLGTAVAFLTGFKSNAAYGRLWEARQIWGAIVNASRSFVVAVRDLQEPAGDARAQAMLQRVVYRHVAWLTALRHQLREPKLWETQHRKQNVEYQARTFAVPERNAKASDSFGSLLSSEEVAYVLARKNGAFGILALQSADIQRSAAEGRFSDQKHVELTRHISGLYEQQGKCERIKNFPYPRQFATINLIFVWIFILLLPFTMFSEFKKLGETWSWLSAPLTALIAWTFHTMDKIGEATENPFEGGPNDVPITAMSRSIEIDLRDLLGEKDLPEPHKAVGNILM